MLALEAFRDSINQHLRRADFEEAGIVIAKAVPKLLELSVDEWVDVDDGMEALKLSPGKGRARPGNSDSESGDTLSGSSDSSSDDDSSEEDAGGPPPVTSYRYRSMLHHPRNPRLEHLCAWLYDTIVHPDSSEEPEEQACQKLPAAILAAWRRLQQQQQQQQQQDKPSDAPQPSDAPAAQQPADGTSHPGGGTVAIAAPPPTCSPASSPPPLPPTEALHLQHSAFTAPFCTWRHVAPDELPPLHDVLVGVLRVCWERHDDREPSRNIIWGAQNHSRRADPVTAYLYVEYLRLLLSSIVRSGAEPLWLWHELQEIIEEYPHWRHHPHEVAVLARMMVEHGCGWRLLNSLLDHIGKGPMLMYGTWAALWDGLRRSEARACARQAADHGVCSDAVWVHVTELTLLQVKEHPRDARTLAHAVEVLTRVLALTPAPVELAELLAAERDAIGSCAGVRHVTSQLQLESFLAATHEESGAA